MNETASTPPPTRRTKYRWFPIRGPIRLTASVVLGILCVVMIYAAWWFVTAGEVAEERIVGPQALPSPTETFGTFGQLWSERKLVQNTWVTLRRVIIGFALAAAVGVPLGVLAGCFPAVKAFLTPVILFGRNIPIAALVPLTFFFFGIGESQKILFIFLACVAFVIADTATSISNVGQEYLDTAYTLGANRWQAIIKVLVPLSMPSVFDSLRLLFGLAFGYIMLAETIKLGSESGGLGNLILTSQRIGPRAHIYLIILIIPIVAFVIDRALFAAQKGLFPHKYGGNGWLLSAWRMIARGIDDLKPYFFRPSPEFADLVGVGTENATSGKASGEATKDGQTESKS
ncbi:ABC transporter permease [Novipirellula aureliae]|uniref:ABC transporter permease n=1 Tax=Novipirellula aureliae TaxID=2527966 RepID=UPI0011B81573|nr:ABC transporter permease [Novipirellula aureliae]